MRRLVLAFLGVAPLATTVALFVDAAWSVWLFAVVAAAFPVAVIALGVLRRDRLGPLAVPLLVLLVLLEASFVAMLLLAGRVESAPWVGGLPLAAAILMAGVLVAPFLLVVLSYAMTFERFALQDADLDALRADYGRKSAGDRAGRQI